MVGKITPELFSKITSGDFLPCSHLHSSSCLSYALLRFFRTCSNVYKQYIILYLIPLLVFKHKKLVRQPKKTGLSTVWACGKSVAFVGAYVAVLTYVLCKMKNWRGKIDFVNPLVGKRKGG
jgi:hypothetical protein